MEKIKINTTSSEVLEKPLITAFKTGSGEYVVIDNEMNGTMGLPIILVSKFANNSLSVVPDDEWNSVKEALRLIISGNQVDYITVPNTLMAGDVFFKQLTLPVASFDVLKSSYRPVQVVQNTVVEPTVMPSVTPQVSPVQSQVINPIEMPSINPAPSTPVMPAAPVESQVIAPVVSDVPVSPAPSVEPIPDVTPVTPVDFTADKEAFLKACENMFDALVAKFNNK